MSHADLDPPDGIEVRAFGRKVVWRMVVVVAVSWLCNDETT